jgi:two-component system OmpR family response regulator
MKTNETLSVYLVDDDEIYVGALKHYLQEKLKETIKIKSFHSGEELLKEIPRQKPDIVILDYILNSFYPFAMDGRSVLQKIKQRDPDMTVIMLSGQDKIEIALDSMKNGAFDYVIKNDNAFLKILSSIKNAIKVISVSRKLKIYRWLLMVILPLIIITILTIIVIKTFFLY